MSDDRSDDVLDERDHESHDEIHDEPRRRHEHHGWPGDRNGGKQTLDGLDGDPDDQREHAGAVIVPAVLAACERYNPDGRSALLGIAVGAEVICRLSVVVPKAVHKAGFHPTAVFGAMNDPVTSCPPELS